MSFQSKLKSILINGFSEIIRLPAVKKTDSSGYWAVFMAAGLIGVIQAWVRSGFKESTEEIAKIFTDINMHYSK